MQLRLDGKRLDDVAIERLRSFEPPEGYWLACSYGKDSIVCLDLAKRANVKYEAHYSVTTVDPPELIYFGREYYPEVKADHPEKSMWRLLLLLRCMPTRFRRWCCEQLKEGGGRGRRVITGIRWAESTARSKRTMVDYCGRTDKWRVNPIIEWSDSDVWSYIRERQLPYCKLYDEGFKRIGCVLCPLKNQTERMKDLVRWPKIAAAWKRGCYRLWESKPTFHEYHPTPEHMWQWWLSGCPGDDNDPNQLELFSDDN